MKKIYIAAIFFVSAILTITGCGKKNDKTFKIDKDGVIKCEWFADKEVDAKYRIRDISFSKDDERAVLAYATVSQKTPLAEYYAIYSSELKGDHYGPLKKIDFGSEYYAISAHISYAGNEIIFTGLPSEQAKTTAGFENGCNLYIGDFADNKVSNIRQLDFKEKNKRYYIVSTLEDGSIIYNSYAADKDTFTIKYAKKNGTDNYEISEITDKSVDGYYWKAIYVENEDAFIWRADQSNHSFTALTGKFRNGKLSDVAQLSPEFMYGKSYDKYYSATGYDRSGGVYFFESGENNYLTFYRSQIKNTNNK